MQAAESVVDRMAAIEEALDRAEGRLSQLAWMPNEIQDTQKKIEGLTSKLTLSQQAVGEARNIQQRTVQMAENVLRRVQALETTMANRRSGGGPGAS